MGFKHIFSCSIAHMCTNQHPTKRCNWYMYMIANNVHWSNLKKTGVLKLHKDKTNFVQSTGKKSPSMLTDKP